MLTQAPPNTGAGWYRADRCVAGCSTGRRTTRSTPTASRSPTAPPRSTAGVLSAETIAQSAERGGKKVIQMEWAGGRNGIIQGPRSTSGPFLSGRGVTTNFGAIGPAGVLPRCRSSSST